jgi:hypothetical protein
LFEDSFSGELSEEQVFFRQLLMITGLASRIYLDTSTEWQVNARNYMEAINNFEATAIRHLDAEYSEKLKQLIAHSRQKLMDYRAKNPQKSATNIGKEYEIALTLYFARRKLALLMKTLDSKDVFTAKTYRAIENPTKKEIAQASGAPIPDQDGSIIGENE